MTKLTKIQRAVLTRLGTNEPLVIVPPVGKQYSEPNRFAFRGACGMDFNSRYVNSRVVYRLKEKGYVAVHGSILFDFLAITDLGRKALGA